MKPTILIAAALCVWLSASAAQQPALHLLFPYDYLTLSYDERRLYLLGVLDARLAPLVATDRLEWLNRCLTQVGLTRVQEVVEKDVIPTPETAVIPMPYVVERALQMVCKDIPKPTG